LFPKNKAHYLNILHAGLAGRIGARQRGFGADAGDADKNIAPIDWKIQMSLVLDPGDRLRRLACSVRSSQVRSCCRWRDAGPNDRTVFVPLMLVLLFIHALVGYVELGTDSWIAKITGSIMGSPMMA